MHKYCPRPPAVTVSSPTCDPSSSTGINNSCTHARWWEPDERLPRSTNPLHIIGEQASSGYFYSFQASFFTIWRLNPDFEAGEEHATIQANKNAKILARPRADQTSCFMHNNKTKTSRFQCPRQPRLGLFSPDGVAGLGNELEKNAAVIGLQPLVFHELCACTQGP